MSPLALIDLLLRRRGTGRSKLKVDQSLGAFPRPGGDISPLFVLFRVENAGAEEVEITRLSIGLGGERRLELSTHLGGERELPYALAPEEAAVSWLKARELAGLLEAEGYKGRPRLKLLVEDRSGNEHPKRFRLRVSEYLKLKDT